MKKIIIYIFLLFSIYSNVNADYIDFENCSNSTYYDNSCTKCGKYSEKFDVGVSKKVWNWYYNTNQKEKIFSVLSNGLLTPLNGANISSSPFIFSTNWIPNNIGIYGNKEIISFETDNVTLNSNVSNSSLPIGLISYNIISWDVDNSGTFSQTFDLKYNRGTENINFMSGKYELTSNIVNSGIFTKTFNSSNINTTKECYLIYGNNTLSTVPSILPVLGNGTCGDGVINRPNSLGINEECDLGSGVGSLWCNSSCKIDKNDSSFGNILDFGTNSELLIGNGQNIYDILNKPYIKNNGFSKIYIKEKYCTSKNINDTFLSGNTLCSNNEVGFINPGEKIELSNSSFIGNTSNIGVPLMYKDSNLITSLEGYENASFAKNTLVRVANPSISTIGGGNVFVKNSFFSNISNLLNGFSSIDGDINKNFIGSVVGNYSESSFTKVINNNLSVNNIESNIIGDLNDLNITFSNSSNFSTIYNLPFKEYNGIDNIYLHKGDVILSDENLLGNSTTYIVEDGDLILNGDIISNTSIAFIVLGGDIKISNNISKIDATFLSMKKEGVGGNIVSKEGTITLNQLYIGGSLYGNINDLISSRGYINKNDSGIIDVGIIVDFSSKYLMNTPPLLSKFLGDYLKSKRVSK